MKKHFLLLSCFVATITFSHAQDSNSFSHDVTIDFTEIAFVDLEGPAGVVNITLDGTGSGPTEAGEPANFNTITDNSLWLNYTSILGNEASRDITVAITNGTVPGGLSLNLLAAADAGNGDGTMGTPTAVVTLTGVGQNLVTGIGSSYTGTGISNGHNLTYSLGVLDFSLLDADNANSIVEVTYTITDTL